MPAATAIAIVDLAQPPALPAPRASCGTLWQFIFLSIFSVALGGITPPLSAQPSIRDYSAWALRPQHLAIGGQMAQFLPIEVAGSIHPAFLAYGEGRALFTGGFFGALTGFFADAILHGPLGGLALSFEHWQAADTTNLLRLGYGGVATRYLATGLNLNLRHSRANGAQSLALGLDPALLWDSKWHTSFFGNDGWGVYAPAVFVRTHNLALSAGDAPPPPASIHFGIFSGLYQRAEWTLAMTVSSYGSERFDRVPLQWGMQLQYRTVQLALGYGASHYRALADGWQLGLGWLNSFPWGGAFLFYSFTPAQANRGALHGLSAGMHFGVADRMPPQISLHQEYTHFSPTNDGVQDLAIFYPMVRDESSVVFYEFTIRDTHGSVVFRQRADERIREKKFTALLFLRSFFAPQPKAELPEKFIWDGRIQPADHGNAREAVMPLAADGTYQWEFYAIDEKNNKSAVLRGEITVDTKPPVAQVALGDDIISPNGDGRRDTLAITQETTLTDSYSAAIISTGGQTVRTWRWLEAAPVHVEFDGKDDAGLPVPEGSYRYRLVGQDAAGNTAVAESPVFYLSRRQEAVYLRSSASALNPQARENNTVELLPTANFMQGYQGGEILIAKRCPARSEDIVQRIAVPKVGDEQNPRQRVAYVWNGSTLSGTRLADGSYCVFFRAFYDNGNIPESSPLSLRIDTTGPELEISADLTSRRFSPDGDGENDEQIFRISAHDASAIASYSLEIRELLPRTGTANNGSMVVRRFRGQGEPPTTIVWDGKTESGAVAESFTLYEYSLTVTDVLGSSSTTPPRRFETGVVLWPTKAGLRIRIPLDDPRNPINERFAQILGVLERYPHHRIKVEVHSQSGAKPEMNLEFSEMAARAVRDFFVERGVAPERITHQGLGDTLPLFPAKSPLAAKNQRIEIFLTR